MKVLDWTCQCLVTTAYPTHYYCLVSDQTAEIKFSSRSNFSLKLRSHIEL